MQTAPNPRQERGQQIAAHKGQVFRVADGFYRVKSQSRDQYYYVNNTAIGWKCDCPDHKFRGTKCKHIWAIEISLGMREQVKRNVVLEPITVTDCPFCHSQNIKKSGIRHNKSGDIQRFACRDCSKIFSFNIGFERMKHNPKAVTTAMQLYFSGESLRNTQRSLVLIGVDVSHQTVANWIDKYTKLMKSYADNLKPDVGSTWRADEVWIKVTVLSKFLLYLYF
jgi:putative transposase